jgi:hypothetical protein
MSVMMFLLLKQTVKMAGTEVKSAYNEMNAMVGDTVIINKDTLVIVNFSVIESTLTLSNGTEIHTSFYKKNRPYTEPQQP